MAANCQVTSTAAITVAIGRDTCSAWVIVAAATNTSPTMVPATAPLAVHAAADPGSRWAASTPPMPPTIADANAAERSRWTSGRVSTVRRSTGASIR